MIERLKQRWSESRDRAMFRAERQWVRSQKRKVAKKAAAK